MTRTSRVAVVTGGGRGIGRGIVLALAEQGWQIAVNYRSDRGAAEATCREAIRRGAPRAVALAADVARIEQGQELIQGVLETFETIDLWVNNAGIAPERRGDLLELTPESWDRVLGTNLRGPFFLTQQVARTLIALRRDGRAAEPQIVFITSVSSTFASTGRGEYCVSKAGLSMVVRLFADRLAEEGIRVYEVRPGIIETDMTAGVRASYEARIAAGISPIRRWGTPEDVGRAVAAIAAGALPFSTGEVLHVDGGLHLPRL